MKVVDIPRACELEFRRWCAEELIDPRLEDILEEAFIAGFLVGGEIALQQEDAHE